MDECRGQAAGRPQDRVCDKVSRSQMSRSPEKIPENIEFAAQEPLDAPIVNRPATISARWP